MRQIIKLNDDILKLYGDCDDSTRYFLKIILTMAEGATVYFDVSRKNGSLVCHVFKGDRKVYFRNNRFSACIGYYKNPFYRKIDWCHICNILEPIESYIKV